MIKLTLVREGSTDEGTFGRIDLPGGTFVVTGELPAKGNLPQISCIPEGQYICRWVHSEREGMCFEVSDVPNRNHILLHAANWMGDASKGYKCQLLGCIAIGLEVGELEGQKAVMYSKAGLTHFENEMNLQDFILVIISASI
jgi:hypothetical protein